MFSFHSERSLLAVSTIDAKSYLHHDRVSIQVQFINKTNAYLLTSSFFLSIQPTSSHLILKELILSVLDLTLKTYQRLYERNQAMSDSTCEKLSLTQNQSLQIIFDLKYLFGLFEYKPSLLASNTSEFDEQINTKYAKLIEEYKKVSALYESLIDPFDYDICLPFMQSNVAKALARSSVSFSHIYQYQFICFTSLGILKKQF